MIIYKATNTINGKCYIGQTVRALKKRKQEHTLLARKGRRDRNHRTYFHNSLNKYDKDSFVWELVDDTCQTQESFCKRMGLNQAALSRVLHGKQGTHKGWTGYFIS